MTLDTMQSFIVAQSDNEDGCPKIFASFSPSTPPVETDAYLLETFHQYPHGDFRPTFYNPFEIKHRRRTSRVQLKILENSFSENSKPSATTRRILAQELDMTPRGVQIWFQNRRAKAKLIRRKSLVQIDSRSKHHSVYRQNNYQDTEDLEEETDNSSDSSKSAGNNSGHHSGEHSTDINQSSVLFSQFFASAPNQEQEKKIQAQPNMPQDTSDGRTCDHYGIKEWSGWHQGSHKLGENARSIATTAAAVVASRVSTHAPNYYEQSLATLGSTSKNWLNVLPHQDVDKKNHTMSVSSRCQSCPITRDSMFASNMHFETHECFHKEQLPANSSPSWANSSYMTSMYSSDYDVAEISSPTTSLPTFAFKTSNSSVNNQISSINYYTTQNINLGHHRQQQPTPPLTASRSVSTVIGSPILLDNLHNESIIAPHIGFYNNANIHLSSPLSTSTLVTDMLPNFV